VFKVPTGKLPGIALRAVALWDGTARLALNDLGVHQDVDSTQIRDVLGWQPHDLREMTVSMADSMVRYGVVTPKPR
jgi:dihydroflavonol-4-reductase